MTTELELQKTIQLTASQRGLRLWRNNCGVTVFCEHTKTCPRANSRPIRYGLANESAQVNKSIKSGDLIGITPYVVQPGDVGRTVGIFTSIEVKRPGWKYRGTPREIAQDAWRRLVESLGGIAKFVSRLEDL